jgi:hypothetical protein
LSKKLLVINQPPLPTTKGFAALAESGLEVHVPVERFEGDLHGQCAQRPAAAGFEDRDGQEHRRPVAHRRVVFGVGKGGHAAHARFRAIVAARARPVSFHGPCSRLVAKSLSLRSE